MSVRATCPGWCRVRHPCLIGFIPVIPAMCNMYYCGQDGHTASLLYLSAPLFCKVLAFLASSCNPSVRLFSSQPRSFPRRFREDCTWHPLLVYSAGRICSGPLTGGHLQAKAAVPRANCCWNSWKFCQSVSAINNALYSLRRDGKLCDTDRRSGVGMPGDRPDGSGKADTQPEKQE